MAAGVRCVEMIPYNTRPCQGVQHKSFWHLAAGVRALAAGAGSARRQQCGRGGVAWQRCRCAGGRGCADQGGRGCAPVPVRGRARARVLLGRGCAVCGILWAWACGRVVFLGAVGGAWCSLRGDGVASVVVVVWCRVVYPPNKTCNAKTSYKYAILVLACKSLCGA